MNYYDRDKGRRYASIRSQRMKDARAIATHTPQDWEALVALYGGCCVRCGVLPQRIQKDHIKPVYQGGSDGLDNLQPLCPRCNAAKGPDSTNWRHYRDARGFGVDA